MKDRAFGVELEFDSNGLGNLGVGELLKRNGVDPEWYGQEVDDSWGNYYDFIGEDGSEIELRSPILRGRKGFKELKHVVTLLKEAGCYVTDSDGLHVHHDAPEFVGNKEMILKVLKSWKANEKHIAKFISHWRAEDSLNRCGPCPTFSDASIESYEHGDYGETVTQYFGRNNINVSPLSYYGTIEFRFHEGTLEWDEIESWIKFGQSFLNSVVARKNHMDEMQDPVTLLNRIRTGNKTKTVLINKAQLVGV